MIDETMSNKDYHDHDSISSTQIRYFLQSPLTFHASISGQMEVEETDAMKFGTIAHSYILERNEDMIVDDGALVAGILSSRKNIKNARSTKEYKEAVQVATEQGKHVVKAKDMKRLEGMRARIEAVNCCKNSINLDFGKPEVSFFTTIDNLNVKARADFFGEKNGQIYMVDYKTTTATDFSRIQYSLGKYGYDIQAAHYKRVVEKCIEKPVAHFFFLFQQKEAPFECTLVRVGDTTITTATKVLNKTYKQIGECIETGIYPSKYGETTVQMESDDYRLAELEAML